MEPLGRGICEGYTLEVGGILRAVRAVEKDLRYHVQFFQESLEKYRDAPPPKRRAGKRR